jgi:hypothetical protein
MPWDLKSGTLYVFRWCLKNRIQSRSFPSPRDRDLAHRDGERFYIRASNATRELNGSSLLRYIREHWPARSRVGWIQQ